MSDELTQEPEPVEIWIKRGRPGRRVIDGDTVELVLDCGFNVIYRDRFRLVGVNCDETRGKKKTEAGQRAKEFTRLWLAECPLDYEWPLLITTRYRKTLDRYLAIVQRFDGRNLADDLIAAGLGTPDPRKV